MRELAETYAPVDPVLLHAVRWAHEYGITPVGGGTGAALRILAATARARHVVEVGTGTGVSGLWLLRGMRPDGMLTTIDIEPECQAIAKQAFAAAGFAPSRARLITGTARGVLHRLNDGAYDLVFIDGAIIDYPHCVTAAHRLLRDGGLVVINNAFGPDCGVVDVDRHDPQSRLLRELVAYLREAPEWLPGLLPTGTGLLCATKTSG